MNEFNDLSWYSEGEIQIFAQAIYNDGEPINIAFGIEEEGEGISIDPNTDLPISTNEFSEDTGSLIGRIRYEYPIGSGIFSDWVESDPEIV